MLDAGNTQVRSLLLKGNFGLEKESLRITHQGRMSHTEDPFYPDPHIVRDFCENQTEINTAVFSDAQKAVDSLTRHTRHIQRTLSQLPTPELLWPFSNPPAIENEADIPVAVYTGNLASKTRYREYLSDRYGRYKMTLCGIHVNFSFADELLKTGFEADGSPDFRQFKDQLYVNIAQKAACCSWILTALTAASPVLDASYFEKGQQGHDIFNGMASTRCSEIGYWNYFTPVFDYTNITTYADSIQNYVDRGLIAAPSELYYPVRLKPYGENTTESLKKNGVSHIELRMFDLNPLTESGIEVRDLRFAQLLLVWIACTEKKTLSEKDQIQAAQKFKSAAHYDLKTVKTTTCDGKTCTMADAAMEIMKEIRAFYKNFDQDVQDILDFEEAKLLNPQLRYAWQIRDWFGNTFLQKGLEHSKQYQKALLS